MGIIKTGLDGKFYKVFENCIQCKENAPQGANIVCFNGYDNAYELPFSEIKEYFNQLNERKESC